MLRLPLGLVLALVLVSVTGCGSGGGSWSGPPSGETPAEKSDPAALAEGKKYLLADEPAGVEGVSAIRKQAKDGDEVVVVGQVGGSSKPFTQGRTSFLLVDPSLKPTAECDCPWDFCEVPKKELAAARLHVKFVDAQGKTLKAEARETFGIKELSTVVVRGKVQRDKKDNVVVVGTGIFVRSEKR